MELYVNWYGRALKYTVLLSVLTLITVSRMIDDLLRLDAKSQESGTDTTRSKKTVSSLLLFFLK